MRSSQIIRSGIVAAVLVLLSAACTSTSSSRLGFPVRLLDRRVSRQPANGACDRDGEPEVTHWWPTFTISSTGTDR